MAVHELALLFLVTVGALTDIRTGKIPNVLTYSAIVLGLSLALIGSGGPKFFDSVGGLALAFLPFFGLFMAGGMGGGDVKMMSAVGALMGIRFTAQAMVQSILVGGLIALLIVIWEGRIKDTACYIGRVMLRVLKPSSVQPQLAIETQVPFGVAICLATFLCLIASWQGSGIPWHLFTLAGSWLPGSLE